MARPTKKCTKCCEELPLNLFSKDSRAKSGVQSSCKVCQTEYYTRNREKYRALKNGNIEYAATMRSYFLSNTENINKYRRERFSTEYGKYLVSVNNHKRRAAKLTTDDGTVTAEALDALMVKQGNRCAITGEYLHKYHIDHIVPISKGGEHSMTNIQFVTPSVNMSKKDRTDYAPNKI